MIFNLKKYQPASGNVPFDDWLDDVSPVFRARIYANLARVEIGNWGNVKPIQGGNASELYELRMFFGPGYRAYFGKDGSQLVILLCGGDKGSQRKDIAEAKKLWNEYLKRKGE